MNAPAGLGLSLLVGRAVAVVVHGPRAAPAIALRQWLELGDPWVPESLHPFHQELGDPSDAAREARVRGCAAANASVRRAIAQLLADMRAHGFAPRGATLLVDRIREPARVRGAHPRAHRAERELYRNAVSAALAEARLPAAVVLDAKIRAAASRSLRRSPRELAATLRAFSHEVGTPWRAPEKNAALGAWLALG